MGWVEGGGAVVKERVCPVPDSSWEGKGVGSLVFGGTERVLRGGTKVLASSGPVSPQDPLHWWVGALPSGELAATVVSAFPSECHFGELHWSTVLNYNLNFLSFFFF